MHTVELLERALALALQLGFRVRHEYLGGSGGGACEIRGQKWIFVDLALSPREQLDQVIDALHTSSESLRIACAVEPALEQLLSRKAA